jgi:hypothetical protein
LLGRDSFGVAIYEIPDIEPYQKVEDLWPLKRILFWQMKEFLQNLALISTEDIYRPCYNINLGFES